MFKRNTLGLGGTALCGALLVSGCANHMSQRSEHEERVERKLLDHSLQIDVGEPKVLELPQRRVKINEQKTFEVTEFEVTRRYDRYTPYQPWREVYEIPLGAVAVVGRRRRERGQRVRSRQPAGQRDQGLAELRFCRAQPVHERAVPRSCATEPGRYR